MFSRGYVENRGVRLAPQVGFEPTTLRLTAETVVAASRCKHNHLQAIKTDYRVNWGDSGGTSPFALSANWLEQSLMKSASNFLAPAVSAGETENFALTLRVAGRLQRPNQTVADQIQISGALLRSRGMPIINHPGCLSPIQYYVWVHF